MHRHENMNKEEGDAFLEKMGEMGLRESG